MDQLFASHTKTSSSDEFCYQVKWSLKLICAISDFLILKMVGDSGVAVYRESSLWASILHRRQGMENLPYTSGAPKVSFHFHHSCWMKLDKSYNRKPYNRCSSLFVMGRGGVFCCMILIILFHVGELYEGEWPAVQVWPSSFHR